MRTRPGRSRSRLRRDYRGGGGLLPSRWRESCNYPATTIRGAALSERLSEARRLSRAKWSATIELLLSDYRKANPAPKFFQTFQKLFKNPIRIFSKPFEKSSGFSAPRLRSCRGRHGLGSGRLGGLGGGRQPPERARSRGGRRSGTLAAGRAGLAAAELPPPRASWLPSAVIMRTSCGRRGGRLMRGREMAGGCNGSVGRVRVRYGVLMVQGSIYTLSYKKRSEGVLEALRAIDIYRRYADAVPGRTQTVQDAQKPRRAYVRTGRKESRPRGAAEGL